MAFTSLVYLMDLDWLKEAYRRTRKDGAVGVDGVTAAEYEQELEGNLQNLLDRAKSGTYRAPPVRRVHIPKGGSTTETRPIGIPTLEDKILQRAVVMLLEPIYEQDFLDCSYIRFADDFVSGFRDARDARRVMEVVPKRFGKYGLTIHPTKSRLVPFRPSSPWANDDRGEPDEPAGTFDLLGFTHYWARSRNGYWVVKLKTATDRFTRAVRSIDHWCRDNRHLPIDQQHQKLNEKLLGHYAYYGVTGNSRALTRFLHEVGACWRRWLNRRNNIRSMTWEKFLAILRRYPLAPVRTVRSTLRYAAKP